MHQTLLSHTIIVCPHYSLELYISEQKDWFDKQKVYLSLFPIKSYQLDSNYHNSITSLTLPTLRSSRRRCYVKKGVLRIFVKFTEKHLCQSLFFNKVADEACNFIKKETLAQPFSCKFSKISKNNFFTEHLWMTASVP